MSASQKGALALGRRVDGSATHNATINNSIFYGNEGAGSATTASVNNGHTLSPNLTLVNNSIGEDNFSNLTSLTNTSSANPMFTSATDFTLQSGSPAIDAGDNSKIPVGTTTDLLGNARIFNTTVDMGVYEYGSTLDVEDFETKKDFIIYPNPTTCLLNIKMKADLIQAEIYNIQGQKVLESTVKSIPVSKLTSGMYVLQIEDVNGNRNTKRFIKI
ncbi:T9SS type A sorting domain-containing protein [Lacinutrix himadriensis]|uniref:T9SS type A sorting domain-containing protein n=1 Tax=Lacinutrix himadriensis TaxID=641549 RepID=UPI0006E337D5|nr:T9SS type A sorting domain-containing protein [Lacinutrix himadriensis]